VLTEFVRAEFSEHHAHVVGRAITQEQPSPGPVVARGVHRMVVGQLAEPLGNRVLVNGRGLPFIVVIARGRSR
jgi:hypothetical protein